MADISFHHGSRVMESAETPVLMRTAQSAVVAIIGTAPDADATVFPLNKPILLKGPSEMTAKARRLGAAGTLKDAVDGVFDQVGTYCHIVRVEQGLTAGATLSNLVGDSATLTGVHALLKCEGLYGRHVKPRIVCVPGFTGSLATSGITAATLTNSGGAGYETAPAVTITPEAGNTPTVAAKARAILGEGANEGKVVAIVFDQHGEGYTAEEAGPTIAIGAAPEGGTTATATIAVGTVGNPVVAELQGVLEKLRAVAIVDGPDTTDEAAVLFRQKVNSQRVYIVDPKAYVWDTVADGYVAKPASPRFAGVQAKVDRTNGFWWSLSNKPINGIGGATRPVSYGDHANYLNEAHVNTIINLGEGYITWGNRVATGDDLWKFISVRRTADFINEAIEYAYLEFVDKPFSKANLKFMIESGNAFMRVLKAEGAILGGRVWLDQERNTETEMAQGRVTLGVEFEPPAPMEDIRLIAHRNILYYRVLLQEVLQEVQSGPLALAA